MRGATRSCWSRPSSIRRATSAPVTRSSFLRVGQSAGYGRRSGTYVAHGLVKDVYVRALHRYSVKVLSGTFDLNDSAYLSGGQSTTTALGNFTADD